VRAARALSQAGQKDSSSGCLLGAGSSGYRLSADLMPALDEIPEAPVELDVQLQAAQGAVRVLTAWGQLGAASQALVLASFTTLGAQSVRALGVALVATDEGVYLRYSDAPASAADGPLPVQSAIARLLSAAHNESAVLYVTAEAATPLAQLVELLRLLPAGRPVALALALPAGTHVPVAGSQANAQVCADGLPALGEGSPEGALDSREIVAALGPLKQAAQACLENAQGRARAGGRLVLALRIDERGAVRESCAQEDAIGDAVLAACVLASTRDLRFPAPHPAGLVDVLLPLSLVPSSGSPQRPLCD
jgi:hypothetical protein